ncbi:hypothetical protein [Streptomyces sp. WZ.A104]
MVLDTAADPYRLLAQRAVAHRFQDRVGGVRRHAGDGLALAVAAHPYVA